jgi:transcriptional regulator with XRE-family HTH domain
MDKKTERTRISLFSQRLRTAIAKAGIKKAALAESAGLTPQSLSRYLRSGRTPHHAIVMALAQKLSVSTEYLLGDSPISANLADTPVAREPVEPYTPDAVALTGLDQEDRVPAAPIRRRAEHFLCRL